MAANDARKSTNLFNMINDIPLRACHARKTGRVSEGGRPEPAPGVSRDSRQFVKTILREAI